MLVNLSSNNAQSTFIVNSHIIVRGVNKFVNMFVSFTCQQWPKVIIYFSFVYHHVSFKH